MNVVGDYMPVSLYCVVKVVLASQNLLPTTETVDQADRVLAGDDMHRHSF